MINYRISLIRMLQPIYPNSRQHITNVFILTYFNKSMSHFEVSVTIKKRKEYRTSHKFDY